MTVRPGTASDAILERLSRLHPKLIDLSLGRIQALLARLGDPQRHLPPVIHVAGTNGKGSTIAFMRAILEAAGRSVHVYTSPHLVSFRERIRLGAPGGGRLIGEQRLGTVLDEVERANAGDPITFFEITTAAAFRVFSEEPADVLLLEVGLGGRLDTTNVIERPAASVVTSIGLDHAEFLGDTIEAVAGEKAGIFRRGCPAVIARQDYDAATETLRRAAERAGARPLRIGGEDFTMHPDGGRVVYQDDDGLLDLPVPRLLGSHQLTNAGAAIAALRAAGFADLSPAIFEAGLLRVTWPGRLERLTRGRLVEELPTGAELWLDGGHNPDGARAVSAAMADLEERSPAPLVLVCGMMSRKDSAGFLGSFRGLARALVAVPVPGSEAARNPGDLAAISESVGIRATTAPDVPGALASLRDTVWERAPRILICGSLYLAGEVLALNGTPPG